MIELKDAKVGLWLIRSTGNCYPISRIETADIYIKYGQQEYLVVNLFWRLATTEEVVLFKLEQSHK